MESIGPVVGFWGPQPGVEIILCKLNETWKSGPYCQNRDRNSTEEDRWIDQDSLSLIGEEEELSLYFSTLY